MADATLSSKEKRFAWATPLNYGDISAIAALNGAVATIKEKPAGHSVALYVDEAIELHKWLGRVLDIVAAEPQPEQHAEIERLQSALTALTLTAESRGRAIDSLQTRVAELELERAAPCPQCLHGDGAHEATCPLRPSKEHVDMVERLIETAKVAHRQPFNVSANLAYIEARKAVLAAMRAAAEPRACNHGALSPKGTMFYHGFVGPANRWRCDVCKGEYEGNLTEPDTPGSQSLTLVSPAQPQADVLEALQQVLLYADFIDAESHADFVRAVRNARAVVRRAEERAPVPPADFRLGDCVVNGRGRKGVVQDPGVVVLWNDGGISTVPASQLRRRDCEPGIDRAPSTKEVTASQPADSPSDGGSGRTGATGSAAGDAGAFHETLEQRQRELPGDARGVLYGRMSELYRKDTPDETEAAPSFDPMPFVGMPPDDSPLSHQEIFSAVLHHASEIVNLTKCVPAQCTAASEPDANS